MSKDLKRREFLILAAAALSNQKTVEAGRLASPRTSRRCWAGERLCQRRSVRWFPKSRILCGPKGQRAFCAFRALHAPEMRAVHPVGSFILLPVSRISI